MTYHHIKLSVPFGGARTAMLWHSLNSYEEWVESKGFLNSRFTIIELCKIIGINRTYLSNYINNTYGLNFNLWINHLRIEEAKQLMGQTPKRSLSEIAERIGFTDLAHFSKQFKLQEGVSPSEWRKNM